MTTSLLILVTFIYDVFKRIIHDAYYRALGTALLLMVLVGTLFLWLGEGRTFFQALTYSAMTMAMNSPYGYGWGPETTVGIIFNIIYVFLSVGLFLLFVLETGKTMVRSQEELFRKMAARREIKHAKKKSNAASLAHKNSTQAE
jgi:hypothetical protein